MRMNLSCAFFLLNGGEIILILFLKQIFKNNNVYYLTQ